MSTVPEEPVFRLSLRKLTWALTRMDFPENAEHNLETKVRLCGLHV